MKYPTMTSKINKLSFVALWLFTLTSFAQNQHEDLSYVTSGGKLNPLQAIMDIRHFTIDLDVTIAEQSISGYCDVKINLAQKSDTLLFDLMHMFKVSKITVNNKDASFSQRDDKVFITSQASFESGNQLVHIAYSGKPPVAVRPPWNGGFTWTKDVAGNDWVAINIQAEGGKMYFPCKDHPSDEPNEGVDMKITVPSNLSVAGPGLLVNVTSKKNKSTYHWRTNYTISNYCILFNIGKYKVIKDSYTTIEGNVVPIEYYILEVDAEHAAKVITTKKRDSQILEKYFGEYPWVKEKIGLAEVPNSGMEHQTMITFDNKFSYTKIGGHDYSANLFHEYAHEWWANKVTNKDWAHMWIQEGIATYAEALAMLELGGEPAYNEMIDRHRRGVKNRKAMVLGDEVTEQEVYSGGDIYLKGSFFMHSLRRLIGDEVFFPTLKLLATAPQYTYDNFVTTDDVEKLFSKAAGQNLKPFFDFYLKTTGKIDVKVKQVGFHKYEIKIANFFMPLPMEISANSTLTKMIVGKEGLVIESEMPPMVDPKGNYLKKVTLEQ